MKNIFSKIRNTMLYVGVVLSSSSAFAANSTGSVTDAASFNKQLTTQIMSFGSLLAILAFMLGAWAVFKCITTFLNHADDPRQNPLKNCAFYFVAAGLGFGYSLSSDLFSGTLWGSGSTGTVSSDNVFKVQTN